MQHAMYTQIKCLKRISLNNIINDIWGIWMISTKFKLSSKNKNNHSLMFSLNRRTGSKT